MTIKNEISFQELIEKVKADLFSPYQGTSEEGKLVYPVFFVTEVELEITVEVTSDQNGQVKINIPAIAEAGLGTNHKASNLHQMKISLEPILSRDELRSMIDSKTMDGIKQASQRALRKGVELASDKE